MAIKDYSTTAGNNNSAPPAGAPEGWAPSAVNNTVRQIMADIRTQHESAQWIDYGHVPTKVDNDTFTVSGDQTAIYDAGRRIKFTGSVSGYATISSSSYSAPNTTVNVSASSWTGTLTEVAVGILSGANNALPIIYKSVKSSSTARSSTTILAADPELLISSIPIGTYALELWVLPSQAASGSIGLKYDLNFSGTVTTNIYSVLASINGTFSAGTSLIGNTPAQLYSTVFNFPGADYILIKGTFVVTAAGSLSFRWAQNTSSINATSISSGSYMKIEALQ